MDEAEPDVLAFMTFPRDHSTKIHSSNPLERVNKEIKRRTNVVGIFPNEAAVTRLVGAILAEQSDEWAVCRRYITLETLAQISDPEPGPLTIAAHPREAGNLNRQRPTTTVKPKALLHYSRGHNPKIKHWMRNAQKRSIDDTCSHLGRLIDTIELSECQNYIQNAGYGSN